MGSVTAQWGRIVGLARSTDLVAIARAQKLEDVASTLRASRLGSTGQERAVRALAGIEGAADDVVRILDSGAGGGVGEFASHRPLLVGIGDAAHDARLKVADARGFVARPYQIREPGGADSIRGGIATAGRSLEDARAAVRHLQTQIDTLRGEVGDARNAKPLLAIAGVVGVGIAATIAVATSESNE